VPPILAFESTRGNAGPIDVRTDVADARPSADTPARRSLAEILEAPRYTDRAKRLAAYLDGRCWGDDKWAAWPKVATIAADLGWDGTEWGGRKRVERAMKELADGGDLTRMNLRELVEWHDAQGASLGISWPAKLPRGMRLSLKVFVLSWRIPVAGRGLPILPRCDTSVASNGPAPAPEPAPGVASSATEMSQGVTSQMSHPSLLKVRRGNEETTTDSSRPCAREGPGDVGSSSSSSQSLESGAGQEATGPDPGQPVAELGDDQVGSEAGGDDLGRAALVAKIEEIAPGPENREIRRALRDAARDLLKTAKLAGSSSPFDHVRMAFEKAVANPRRRDTPESLARGIMRNWAREGLPAIVAPKPPGLAKSRPDPEADRVAAVERRRSEARADAEARDRRERWELLPEPAKEAAWTEFERANPRPTARPLVSFWEVQRRDWCLLRMDPANHPG
jgi:hypothetical protein